MSFSSDAVAAVLQMIQKSLDGLKIGVWLFINWK